MGSWMLLNVEVSASDRRHADTQFGYAVEAIERLGFVMNVFEVDYQYEEDQE